MNLLGLSMQCTIQKGDGMFTNDERRQRAEDAIAAIGALPEDWNNNGASAFSAQLVSRASRVLDALSRVPVVTPTAFPSIQMEYRDEDRGYLEFEMYEDGSAKQYARSIGSKRGTTQRIRQQDIPAAVRQFFKETV